MKNWFGKLLDSDDPHLLAPWKDKSPEPQGETPEDRPDVSIKPAWYFIIYFIMGVGFDTLFPAQVFPESMRFTLGAGLVLLGALLNSTSIARFKKHHTHHALDKPAHTLVTDGPYRFSRNPIYLGYACLYVGLAIFLDNAWIFVLAAPLVATIHVVVVRPEEDYLAGKFGGEYHDYCGRVRPWL